MEENRSSIYDLSANGQWLTLSLGFVDSLAPRSGMHANLSLNDETIFVELSNVLSYYWDNNKLEINLKYAMINELIK